jgi:protein-disulfide isomerase
MPIPVPSTPPGYRLGSGNAPLQVEAFIDVECPFSKKAWPTLMALVNGEDDRLAVTVHPIVLCDHRQSWDLTKALVAIAGRDALKAWKFLSHLYQRQQQFANEAFDTNTREDLFKLIEKLTEEFASDTVTPELMKGVRDDTSDISSHAKTSIRYAILQGVWSTPTFLINGTEVPQLESSSTLQDWQKFLADI